MYKITIIKPQRQYAVVFIALNMQCMRLCVLDAWSRQQQRSVVGIYVLLKCFAKCSR